MAKGRILLVGLLLLLSLSLATIVWAGGGYDLSWWTMDGGGGTVTGSSYTLSGTVGQPDAASLSGGGYVLSGGFWHSTGRGTVYVYLPLVLK